MTIAYESCFEHQWAQNLPHNFRVYSMIIEIFLVVSPGDPKPLEHPIAVKKEIFLELLCQKTSQAEIQEDSYAILCQICQILFIE